MSDETQIMASRRTGKSVYMKELIKQHLRDLKPGQSIGVMSAKDGYTKITRNSDQIEHKK